MIRDVVCCVITLCYMFLLAKDMPLSLVYNRSHGQEEMLETVERNNVLRVEIAKRYISSLDSITMPHVPSEVDLVVVIVTVSRQRNPKAKDAGYLLQTAASMHHAVQGDNLFKNKLLFICNVDDLPSEHVDAVSLKNSMHFLDKTSAENNMGINPPIIPELQNCGLHDEIRKREVVDYAYCLNASLKLNPKHVLVLEDDVLPKFNLFPVLNMFLTKSRFTNTRFGPRNKWEDGYVGNTNETFSFLKLYYPLRWQGFAFESDRVLEIICICLCGGGICLILRSITIVFCKIIRKTFRTKFQRNTHQLRIKTKSKIKPTHRRYSQTSALYLIYSITAVLIAVLVGRINIFDFRRFHPQLMKLSPSSACCTQAMLYPAHVIPAIINHLLVDNNLNKDLAIYDFSMSQGPVGYQFEPNVFLHTGMYTSLSGSAKGYEEFVVDAPI